MIVGVGIDVVEVARLERALRRTPALAQRLFTERERGRRPASLAARVAAKEAVAKALGAPPGLSWLDAEVVEGAGGRPELVVTGRAAAEAAELGVRDWQVSLAHDAGIATAVVVAQA